MGRCGKLLAIPYFPVQVYLMGSGAARSMFLDFCERASRLTDKTGAAHPLGSRFASAPQPLLGVGCYIYISPIEAQNTLLPLPSRSGLEGIYCGG